MVVRKSCGHNARAGSTPASATTKPLSFMEGFFVFLNIYLYIRNMKDIFKNLTKEQLMELLTKTDIPQKWEVDKIIKYKNSGKSNKNKTDNN